MRARFKVDFNPRLRKGDEVPADMVRRMVRSGLAEPITEAGEAEGDLPPLDEVPLERRLKADLFMIAEGMGLPVEIEDTKAALVAKIRAAEAD